MALKWRTENRSLVLPGAIARVMVLWSNKGSAPCALDREQLSPMWAFFPVGSRAVYPNGTVAVCRWLAVGARKTARAAGTCCSSATPFARYPARPPWPESSRLAAGQLPESVRRATACCDHGQCRSNRDTPSRCSNTWASFKCRGFTALPENPGICQIWPRLSIAISNLIYQYENYLGRPQWPSGVVHLRAICRAFCGHRFRPQNWPDGCRGSWLPGPSAPRVCFSAMSLLRPVAAALSLARRITSPLLPCHLPRAWRLL